MKRILLIALAVLAFSIPASATTYYVAAIGADTNNGTTKTTPWLHAPGMTNCASTCASTTPAAGDSVIFRGGDTWHFGTNTAPYVGAMFGWNWTWSGTSGSRIYVGVDQTWFTGGSWVKPVMAGDNALWNGTTWPSSCAHDFVSANQSVELGASFITFDNFEITGFCLTGSNGFTFFDRDQSTARHGLILSNMYCHGWTMTAATVANFSFFTSLGNIPGGVEQTDVISGNIVDGTDSPHFPTGSNCTASADPCASGQAVYGWAWDVHNNVFRYLANVAVTLNTSLWHDNLTEYLETAWSTAAVNNQHSNILNNLGGAAGESMYFYNNIMRHTFVTEDVYFGVRTNIYIYNNVMYDNMNNSVFAPGPGPGACIRLNNVSNSTQPTTAYIYNNMTDSSCQFKFEIVNSPLTAWKGVGNFQNNHFVDWSPATLASVYDCAVTAPNCVIHDNGGEVFQTLAVANSQGYTQSNNFAPTLSSNATVTVAGGNLTSSCSAFGSALCSGTTGAASSTGSSYLFPSITVVARPSSGNWNAGPYQFSSGGGSTPPPPTPFLFLSKSMPPATVGLPYSFLLVGSGGTPPYKLFTVNPTTPGMTLAPSTGIFSGTPTTAIATLNLNFSAQDSGTPAQSATVAFPITINSAPSTPLSKATMLAIPALKFSGVAGAAIASQTLTVDDTSPFGALFTVANNSNTWLSVNFINPKTSSSPNVTVSVNSTGLVAGTYNAVLTVSVYDQVGPNGSATYTWTNSPILVPVTLTLSAPPPPPTLGFSCSVTKSATTTATLSCPVTGWPTGNSLSITATPKAGNPATVTVSH